MLASVSALALKPELRLALAAHPATPVLLLVLPKRGIACARLCFDVIPPHVFCSAAGSPEVLASDAAGVTPDTLIEIKDHRDLGADIHVILSSLQVRRPVCPQAYEHMHKYPCPAPVVPSN